MPLISIVFRALNEEKWFDDALSACRNQIVDETIKTEIVLVDSGSTDRTLEIAEKHGCNIVHIHKSEFTFGRSLNMGCEAANGEILVFISAHCIPRNEQWLAKLIAPLMDGSCDYTYGCQVGRPGITRFSEDQVFAHYYPEMSDLKQDGFFCNNANAAITRSLWEKHRFDEEVTGLEDMVLAKEIVRDGGQIGYVADASVIHIHEESFKQVQTRFFREALVMRDIMPEVQFNSFDFVRCLGSGLKQDIVEASRSKALTKELSGIFAYRFAQYWGTYRGHNEHRALSRSQKQSYYYPSPKRRRTKDAFHRRKVEPISFDAEVKSSQ